MTLVVARRHEDKVFVVSDTLIAGGREDYRKREYALKSFALDPRTLIAYAESPHVFMAHLSKSFPRIVGKPIDRIVEVFFEITLTSTWRF